MPLTEPAPALQSYRCPRCDAGVQEAFYGPCTQCRTALRAEMAGEARVVDGGEYIPKMNVTPNAVATKD